MKVLFVSHYPGVGGANRSMISLIEKLRLYDVYSYVLIPSHGPIEIMLKRKDIDYKICRYASLRTIDRGRVLNKVNAFIRPIINWMTAFRLTKNNCFDFDIIHANSSLVFLGCTLKRMSKAKLVWHIREFGEADYNLIFPHGMRHARRSYQEADKIITISKSLYDDFNEKFNLKERSTIIYNGIDHKKYHRENDTKKSRTLKITKVCIIGGLSEEKNQIELIRSLSYIKNRSISLDIIGEGSEKYTHLLRTEAKQVGDIDINFLGQVDNVESILPSYDIGIITSKKEAFGRVIIEYMLSGLTVIASNTGACVELIDDGRDGLLYELGNPKDLASKLDSLTNSENFRAELSNAGYEKSLQYYTADVNAANIYNLYKQVLRNEK